MLCVGSMLEENPEDLDSSLALSVIRSVILAGTSTSLSSFPTCLNGDSEAVFFTPMSVVCIK